jgi:hypothetical protein
VPPAAATYLLGKAGAILIVLMLFMAVTSSGESACVCSRARPHVLLCVV